MRLLIVSAAALLLACDPSAPSAPRVPSAPEDAPSETPVAAPESPTGRAVYGNDREAPAPRPVTAGDPTRVDLQPPAEVLARPRRRMTLDQLAQAMPQVSGGIGWTEQRGNNQVDLFVELSATLGKPDYVQVVSEDLEPSALFLKFLDDASRSICARMVRRDVDADPGADMTIFAHVAPNEVPTDAAIDANLAYLVERFHGRRDAVTTNWRWLFDSVVHVTGEPIDGWNAVCVGLFTHVDFYSY
ncbi:MAG: hypothetical protein ACI9U2_001251 [Bradymonadia bacterium]|jgi:hypothetical protein